MGELVFKFTNFPEDDHWKSAQHLEIKHNLDLAKKIVIDSDTLVEIDYQKYSKGIVWDDFNDLDIEIREKLKEISEYYTIATSLSSIRNQLGGMTFDESYKITRLANNARDIIAKIPLSKHFPYINFMMSADRVGNIEHTINKEVSVLSYYKRKDSKRSKEYAVRDAVHHLNLDIMVVENTLKDFDLSPDYDYKNPKA